MLAEAAIIAESRADFTPSSAEYRTESGEVYAELGNYEKAGEEWKKLIATGAGKRETYLDAATVYWYYFQYEDALRTIVKLREKFADETLYAFETGAILEAQHKQNEAISEYVKALDANGETDAQKEKAKKRLAFLAAKKGEINERKQAENEFEKTINAAFLSERAKRKDASFLVLGYAEFLVKIKQTDKAEMVLSRAIRQSGSKEFLEAAKYFYQTEENKAGEQTVLKRLSEIAASPRQTISYKLQLAESFEENHDRDAAKAVLVQLVAKFPLNYGVLTEASDFYQRLGYENESAAVLQNALPKSVGAYRTALAQKLAGRSINLDRLDSAAQILTELHNEDKADTEIFGELARVFVRRNDAANLRKTFLETAAAIKQTGAEPRETDEQVADLRVEMIDAFTRLKDYKSATEQHIEIINREPENEELTENAIRYVRRYGGAETLINYYQKTSAEAFKNYRWNVVLARIYEANSDFENALKNYRTAIVNQPEMPELYLAIAEIETKRNNYDEAVKNLDTVLEITNDAPEYVKRKIEILKKAGRTAEIEAEKAKLPIEAEKKIVVDRFAEARNPANTEKESARAIYREAFANLLENPVRGELKAADISAYVQSVREGEPLDQINERLWQLREKLIEIADENASTDAGEARKRISTLDGALTESIGTIAKTIGTDDELAALHEDLQKRISETSFASDKHQSVALIQDVSRRAGFGDLEEKILLKKLDETNFATDKQIYLRNLINFYNERGAYRKIFDVLEKYGS
ncbi:MAG: tetratricopeptide repeat protein, partial [Pyrinomonadaceae bacterium]|nr:tetratricopeptide repeat protein [Pyrinomonadaceae bacterium]